MAAKRFEMRIRVDEDLQRQAFRERLSQERRGSFGVMRHRRKDSAPVQIAAVEVGALQPRELRIDRCGFLTVPETQGRRASIAESQMRLQVRMLAIRKHESSRLVHPRGEKRPTSFFP